ncbi:DUF892 family protein [Neorhizobium sp. P12A]|uniref:DUF892 family protein n=1 Tax=Rhizobium/Agrobacterium group TaxID=227290 RepID=UPI001045BE63|nr:MULTISPECIES: DUF892 family protein [Rhizobium/Agrobacterium group]KAA0690926.1 DUF892 family protein [Neorhizobium sp. P12A]
MASAKTLDDLLFDALEGIYFVEKQILKAFPKLARASQFEEITNEFEDSPALKGNPNCNHGVAG